MPYVTGKWKSIYQALLPAFSVEYENIRSGAAIGKT